MHLRHLGEVRGARVTTGWVAGYLPIMSPSAFMMMRYTKGVEDG